MYTTPTYIEDNNYKIHLLKKSGQSWIHEKILRYIKNNHRIKLNFE